MKQNKSLIQKSKNIINLFIDTTQSDFVAFVFNKDFQLIKKEICPTKYKVEKIVSFFKENKIHPNSINNVYLNLGPGSFVGSRVALVFIRSLAQLNKNIGIFSTNSFKLLSLNNNLENLCIPKSKSEMFCLNTNNINSLNQIEIKKNIANNYSKIDYFFLANNFKKFLHLFSLEKNLAKIKINYVANPQIGALK